MQKIYPLLVLILISCKTMKSNKEVLGKASLENLSKSEQCSWVNDSLGKYHGNPSTLNQLARISKKGLKWKVYIGCWCDDSQKLLPMFLDVMKDIGFPKDQIEFIALDLNKTSPGQIEKEDKIEYVPTFILFNEGKEVGRIVESIDYPMESVIFGLFDF